MVSFQNAKLLYRATRDGFSASSFHRNCDGFPNTVSIIKTDSNYVFGGFSSIVWNTTVGGLHNWFQDENAFLFSLRRSGVSTNIKLDLDYSSNNFVYAVYASPDIILQL